MKRNSQHTYQNEDDAARIHKTTYNSLHKDPLSRVIPWRGVQDVYNKTYTTTHVHLVSVGVHVEDAAEDGDGLGPSTRRRTGAGELVQQEQGSREQGGSVQ